MTDGDIIGTLRIAGGMVCVGLRRFLRLARIVGRMPGGVAVIGRAWVPTREPGMEGIIVLEALVPDEQVRWI